MDSLEKAIRDTSWTSILVPFAICVLLLVGVVVFCVLKG